MRFRIHGLVFFLVGVVGASAQEYRGTLLGRVTDPSGAVVAGAAIEVVNVNTNVVTKTTSNEQGNYHVPFLVPGEYTIRVEHPGFKRLERAGLRVSTNQQVTVDLALEVGAPTEAITVTASAPLLTTANADLGQVVDNVFVRSVSVSMTRNVLNFIHMAPGVTGVYTGTYTSLAQGSFSIAGGGSMRGRTEVLVDGIPNTVALGGGSIVFVPSLDAVEEVKVHTTMFDAAYGHSNAGVVNITTRAGTNEFHGAAYLFKRWAALNANSWTNNRAGLPRPPTNYYQWGYMFSGPVWIPRIYQGRNRTFFTTALELDRDPRELTRQGRVATPAERQGDFSGTLNNLGGPLSLFDPATTRVFEGRAVRDPFPGVRIPAVRLSPIGTAVLGQHPQPNLPGTPQLSRFNWAATGVYRVEQEQVSFRIDHNLSDRQRLFARLGRAIREQLPDMIFPAMVGFPQGTHDIDFLLRRFYNFGLDDTFTFSPTFIASVRYGAARRLSNFTMGGAGWDPAQLKLPEVLVRNQTVKGWPIFNMGENIPTMGSQAERETNELHSLLGTVNKLIGGHSLRFGGDYRLSRWNRVVPGSAAAGNFTFTPVFTQADPYTAASAQTSGTSMASLLLGAPLSGSFGYNSAVSVQNHYLAWFVQDDWKVNRRLTLNFGIRYELETPYTERYNRMSYGFDENARLPVQVPGLDLRGGILFAGVGGHPRRGGPLDRNNFGPRFGFAYSLGPRTVARGGYGLFYSSPSFNTEFRAEVGVFNAVTPYVGSIDNGATIFTTLADPFPAGLRQPLGAAAGLMAQVGDSVSFFDGRRVAPYNQQWQFSLQRELPSQILVEAAYAGMHSVKQLESFNLNEKPDLYLPLGAAENIRVPNPFLGVFPSTSVLGQGSTILQRQLWVRFPQFTSVTIEGVNTGRALYHALQLRVEKRLTRGLSFLWTYTNSKLMDNNSTSIVNERRYRCISSIDQPQVMRLAFSYQLPFRFEGEGWRKVARQVMGGWSLGGFLHLASGTPLSITHANGRPIRIRNPRLTGPISRRLGDQRDATGRLLNPYFDITAFVPLKDQYTISPEPPFFAELRAPGHRSLNLNLLKNFSIHERLRLQARLEVANVTNTPWFGAPGTNMSAAATFGVITSGGNQRSMQGGLRLMF